MEKYFEIISKIRQNAREKGVPILRDESCKLLKMLVSVCQPQKILEIGTAVGYSGIEMLSQCENAHLTTIEKDEVSAEIAKQNFKELDLTNRVTQYVDDAINILPTLTQKFDFIFLDGPKGQYIKYLPYLLNLLNLNGVLIADNVYYQGMVNGKVEINKKKKTLVTNLQKFNKQISSNENLNTVILDLEDGISISRKMR